MLLAISLPSHAFMMSGTNLVEAMEGYEATQHNKSTATQDYQRSATYMGYIFGVTDAYDDFVFCPPGSSTGKQYFEIVRKYIKDNPEEWSGPALFLVTEPLKTAFPCKK